MRVNETNPKNTKYRDSYIVRPSLKSLGNIDL